MNSKINWIILVFLDHFYQMVRTKQNTLRNISVDIPGAMNIGDDILIFGESETEHDEILR